MRTTPEETQKNDKRILDAAIRIFTEKGYADVNMQDIADELGMTKGPLYYRYRTKADLFEAALRQSGEDQLAEYRRLLAQDKPFLDKIRDILMYGTRNMLVEQYSMTALAVQTTGGQAAMEIYQYYMQCFQQLLGEAVQQAISAGELRADTDLHQLFITLSVYARGIYDTVRGTELLSSQEDIQACVEDAVFLIQARCGAQ